MEAWNASLEAFQRGKVDSDTPIKRVERTPDEGSREYRVTDTPSSEESVIVDQPFRVSRRLLPPDDRTEKQKIEDGREHWKNLTPEPVKKDPETNGVL